MDGIEHFLQSRMRVYDLVQLKGVWLEELPAFWRYSELAYPLNTSSEMPASSLLAIAAARCESSYSDVSIMFVMMKLTVAYACCYSHFVF